MILCDRQLIDEQDILTSSPVVSGSIADYLNLQAPLMEIRRQAAEEAEKCAIESWK